MQNTQKEAEDKQLIDIFDLCDVACSYGENTKPQTVNHSVNERDRSPTVRVRQEFTPIQPNLPKRLTIFSFNTSNYIYPIVKPECIECVEERRRLEKLSCPQFFRESMPYRPNYHPIVPNLPSTNHFVLNTTPNINNSTNSMQESQEPPPIPLQSVSSQNINPLYQKPLLANPFLQTQQQQQQILQQQSFSTRPKDLSKDHPLVQTLTKFCNNITFINCRKCGVSTFVGSLFTISYDRNQSPEYICFNCCSDSKSINSSTLHRLKPFISVDNHTYQFNNNNNHNMVNTIDCFGCGNKYHPICYIRYISNHFTLSQICLLCNLKYRRCNNNNSKLSQKLQQRQLMLLPSNNNNNNNNNNNIQPQSVIPQPEPPLPIIQSKLEEEISQSMEKEEEKEIQQPIQQQQQPIKQENSPMIYVKEEKQENIQSNDIKEEKDFVKQNMEEIQPKEEMNDVNVEKDGNNNSKEKEEEKDSEQQPNQIIEKSDEEKKDDMKIEVIKTENNIDKSNNNINPKSVVLDEEELKKLKEERLRKKNQVLKKRSTRKYRH